MQTGPCATLCLFPVFLLNTLKSGNGTEKVLAGGVLFPLLPFCIYRNEDQVLTGGKLKHPGVSEPDRIFSIITCD